MSQEGPGITFYLVYLIFIATLGPFQFGYHLGELNAPEKVITCNVGKSHEIAFKALPQCIPMEPAQWALVSSIFTLGGLCGALIGGPLAGSHGRLRTMRLLTAALFLGPLTEALAPGILLLDLGRFISGLGAGAATVVCPIYVSEISPLHQRGLLGAFTQVMINMGILLAQFLGLFLSRGSLWRIILAVAGLIAAVEFLGLLAAPETPKYLAEHNHEALARRVLQRIRGPETDIEEEIKDWHLSGEEEQEALINSPNRTKDLREAHASFLEVIKVPKYRQAVIAVTAVMTAQQFCGINSVVMYSVSILGTIIPTGAVLVTVIVSAINVVVTVICAPLADRIGRRICLLLSIAGMGTNSVLLAVGLSLDIPVLSVIATLLFVASFGVGLGPVPFILASELVGPEAVGATQSWALASNWLATFCVAQFFPIINASLPRGQVYWIFAAIAVIFGSFIAWWVPESKGKASADEVWGRTSPRRSD